MSAEDDRRSSLRLWRSAFGRMNPPAFVAALLVLMPLWGAPGGANAAQQLTASVDEQWGLPQISIGGGIALSGSYVFWTKNWGWTPFDVVFKINGPFDYSVSGIDQTLRLNLSSRAARTAAPQQLRWQLDIDVASAIPDAVGGGIVFPIFTSGHIAAGSAPVVAGKAGLDVGAVRSPVRNAFRAGLANIYFEPGSQSSQLRAFFYAASFPQAANTIALR